MSPIISGGGGGSGGSSSLVTESAQYSGVPVSISNGGSAAADWSILDVGDDMLDATNPLLPTARKAGLFTIFAEVTDAGGFTAGGFVIADLTFDYTGAGVTIGNFAVGFAGGFGVRLLVGGTYKLAAGQAIQLLLDNEDGVSTRNLLIKNSFVSRVGPA